MAVPVVEAVGLSKRYKVAAATQPGYRTFREDLTLALRGEAARRRLAREVAAVQDATFKVEPGEAVGLIGPNGAGKSTLMKMLARVTRPTSGFADIRGRVGALLEVGTGFHPELTGRENVRLSGAILGMSSRDVAAAFDEIVEFAELAEFIDVPVKRYSSGMYARLGFAVAAHLRPSLLIVDEVLSVGDLQFQAKCLDHMTNLTKEGVAILFVSHNLLAVADFCTRSLVMTNGRVRFDGGVTEAIRSYRDSVAHATIAGHGASGDLDRIWVDGELAGARAVASPGTRFIVEIELDRPIATGSADAILNAVIETPDGRTAVHLRSDLSGAHLLLGPGVNFAAVEIDDIGLVPGEYILWFRLVETRAGLQTMRDSRRLALTVSGDRRVEAIAQPSHRFYARQAVLGTADASARLQANQ